MSDKKPSAEQVESAKVVSIYSGMKDRGEARKKIAAFLASRDEALIRPWREAVENIQRVTQSAQDCADGTKVHNPDGDGDEMCEEGLCFDTGWKDVLKWCADLLTPLAKPQGEPKP